MSNILKQTTATTLKQLKTKVNEIIDVVNFLDDTHVSNAEFRSALANTNSYIATKTNESTSLARLANTNSYIATKVNTSTFNAALANTNAYIQSISLAANATFINNAPSATGSSLIFNRINSTVYFKRIKAGRNIVISEHNGDLILTAIEQRDYGYVNNDFGSITSPPDTNNLYDYGSI